MNRYDENCSKLPEDEKGIPEIALARCECLMERYLRWKGSEHRKSNWAQRVALVFTAITPVILIIPIEDGFVNVKLLGAASSAVAAIATGLMAIHGWRDNYIRYGYTWHALQTEKYRYLSKATKEYSDKDKKKAARFFANRIEQIVMAEVADWRAEMQRVEQKQQDN